MIIRSTSVLDVNIKCYAVLIIITISDKKLISQNGCGQEVLKASKEYVNRMPFKMGPWDKQFQAPTS